MEPTNQPQINNEPNAIQPIPTPPKSNKKWIVIGIIIILILGGAVFVYNKHMPTSTSDSVKLQEYSNVKANFAFDYPTSWVIGDINLEGPNPETNAMVKASRTMVGGYPVDEKDNPNHISNITFQSYPGAVEKIKDPKKEFRATTDGNLIPDGNQQGIQNMKVTKPLYGPIKNNAGFEYYGVEWSLTGPNGPVHSAQYFIIKGNDLYGITAFTKDTDYVVNSKVFEGVVQSFRSYSGAQQNNQTSN